MLEDEYRVPHLILRGTYIPGTTRCSFGEFFRAPSYAEEDEELKQWDIDTLQSFKCYIDLRVGSYVVGSGPPRLTILLGEDYHGYGEDQAYIDMWISYLEEFLKSFEGLEHFIFLGPPLDLSSEAWQLMGGYWEVQRGKNGTTIAVHWRRDLWANLRGDDFHKYQHVLEMKLPDFREAARTAHQARVAEYGGRIGADPNLPMLLTDAHQLGEYYVNLGAYDHPDGPPSQPPPVPGTPPTPPGG